MLFWGPSEKFEKARTEKVRKVAKSEKAIGRIFRWRRWDEPEVDWNGVRKSEEQETEAGPEQPGSGLPRTGGLRGGQGRFGGSASKAERSKKKKSEKVEAETDSNGCSESSRKSGLVQRFLHLQLPDFESGLQRSRRGPGKSSWPVPSVRLSDRRSRFAEKPEEEAIWWISIPGKSGCSCRSWWPRSTWSTDCCCCCVAYPGPEESQNLSGDFFISRWSQK